MSAADEEDFEIVGPVPGQVGKVFTILALTESGSFTNPEHDPLLARIQYSTEETAAAGLLNQAPDEVEKRSGGRRRWNWRKIVVCLCLWMAYTLCNAAYSIINPFFPQVAEKKGASPILIGVIISSSPFCVVVSSPVIGYLLPYIDVWLQVFLGLLLIGCSYISLGFANLISSEWSFVLSCVLLRVVEGVGTAFLTTAIFSTFPKLFPKSVGTLVGLFELGAGFGYSVGPSVGGALYQYGGYKVPFVSVGVLVLVFVLPCTLLVMQLSVKYEKKSLPSRLISKLCTNVLFILLLLVMAMAYNPVSFYAPALPPYLERNFDQTPLQIGVLYFSNAMVYLFVALPMGPLIDKVGHHRYFTVFGLFGLCLSQFTFGVLNYYTVYQSVWVVRFAYGGFAMACAITIIPIYPDLLKIGERYLGPGDSKAALSSFVSGLITSAANLSLVIGPLVGGAITTVMPVPMCSVIIAEVIGSQALLLLGVSLIYKYTESNS